MKKKYDIKMWRAQLAEKGYREQWAHRDRARYIYEAHSHPVDTAYVALTGEMRVEIEGAVRTYLAGEMFEIQKKKVHRVEIGPQECTFLIGVKI